MSYEKIKIYDYKEIEIDDADIPFLNYKQTLYVSLDGIFNERKENKIKYDII